MDEIQFSVAIFNFFNCFFFRLKRPFITMSFATLMPIIIDITNNAPGSLAHINTLFCKTADVHSCLQCYNIEK